MINPPHLPGGTSKAAQFFRDHLNYTKSLKVYETEDIAVSHTAEGIGLRIKKKAGTQSSSSQIVRCRVGTVFDSYLECNILGSDGTPGEGTINVAMPLALRKSTYDGIGYTHLLGGKRQIAGSTVFEIVEPWWYNAASPIYAGLADTGTGLVDADMVPIDYIDLNVDALHWDLPKNTFEVCVVVGGVKTSKTAIIRGMVEA